MSTPEHEDFVSIGDRFRKERERLLMTQKQLAGRLVTTEKTIIGYEGGKTPPKLSKLVLFYGLGADIQYILVGKKSQAGETMASTPASHAATEIARMKISESDAELLLQMAKRLAG